jgi:hypothetical protein
MLSLAITKLRRRAGSGVGRLASRILPFSFHQIVHEELDGSAQNMTRCAKYSENRQITLEVRNLIYIYCTCTYTVYRSNIGT